MNNVEQKDAWNSLYQSQGRQWRGMSDIPRIFGSGDHILDVGCGNGKTSVALMEMGCNVTGMDFSEEAVMFCHDKFPEMKVTCGSVTTIPFSDETFDGIAAVHIFEHLTDSEMNDAVTELYRILKPNGKIFFRSFSVNDMRAKGNTDDVRGNGIRYRYFTEDEVFSIFGIFNILSMELVETKTKFGDMRSRVEAVLEKRNK